MFRRTWIIRFILMGILVWCGDSSGETPLESLVPKRDIPREWTLIHGPQTYNKKSLFEHINGQAELYLKYGFRQSVFAIYQNKNQAKKQIEVDIYDMGNVVQAFGVFSRFRNEDRPGGFGFDSFLDDNTALFYKGRYYVMLYTPEKDPDSLKQFSKLVSSKISDPSSPPKEISFFPKHGLKPGSIQYFPEGLLGHQFLKSGFQGTYIEEVEVKDKVEDKNRAKTGSKEFNLFLAIFKNPQEAEGALKIYQNDLAKKGKVLPGGTIQLGSKAFRGEDPYQGKVMVLQEGFYVLGSVGFEKEEVSENRLAEFVKSVR